MVIDETLTLDGVAIEQIGLNCETKWFKFLGMRLDDKLSWEGQQAHVYQKAAAGAAQNQIDDLQQPRPTILWVLYWSMGVLKSKRPEGLFQITENVCSPHFGGWL